MFYNAENCNLNEEMTRLGAGIQSGTIHKVNNPHFFIVLACLIRANFIKDCRDILGVTSACNAQRPYEGRFPEEPIWSEARLCLVAFSQSPRLLRFFVEYHDKFNPTDGAAHWSHAEGCSGREPPYLMRMLKRKTVSYYPYSLEG